MSLETTAAAASSLIPITALCAGPNKQGATTKPTAQKICELLGEPLQERLVCALGISPLSFTARRPLNKNQEGRKVDWSSN